MGCWFSWGSGSVYRDKNKQNKRERAPTTVLKGTDRVGDRVEAVKQGTLGEEMEVKSNGYTATQMCVWEGVACWGDTVPRIHGRSMA